ncbi:hypothetical protein GCM10010519_50150 [Streptomyces lactacystinicus]
MFECDGESVGGGARQTGGGDQPRQRGGARLQCAEHQSGLVENADAASVVHSMILQSQLARRKSVSMFAILSDTRKAALPGLRVSHAGCAGGCAEAPEPRAAKRRGEQQGEQWGEWREKRWGERQGK